MAAWSTDDPITADPAGRNALIQLATLVIITNLRAGVMAKAWTTQQNERRYRDGLGRGEGLDYKSWLQAHDFASRGVTTRMTGRLIKRQYVTFSNHERHCLLILQRLPSVVDIREQFPLWPLEETVRIASKIDVRHPQIYGQLKVVTTDFLLTVTDGKRTYLVAIEVKPSNMLDDRRTVEKLDIQREFWRERDVEFRIVTERQLPPGLVANLEWIDECHELAETTIPSGDLQKVLSIIRDVSSADAELSLKDACVCADGELGLKAGASLSGFRHALARRLWKPSLATKIDTRNPLAMYGGPEAWVARPTSFAQETAN